ncbi:site-specific DNA-methyltransferase [Methylobacter tundripaludum]|uniref:site-specific DNA-methyltransferase n=1 Tax=Methylobacter tundripaludum TaxID=173365 RepID=UPI000564D573|nr:site-specific DNA-methyltransferase [Methylobacter tundripaludum]
MSKKQKLELTWIGKDKRPRLEPRILLEDKALSYRADDPITSVQAEIPFAGQDNIPPKFSHNNLLIHGDNLLALKALEQQYAGKVKCVFIDPPYNTGSAFTHYDDGVEHSLWLSLMRDRLEAIRTLLAEDGSLWITIDDNEAHYLKVLCDEVFGRGNFVANAIWQKKYAPQNDAKWLSDSHDHILIFAKNKNIWRPNLLPRTDEMNSLYKNPDKDPRGLWMSDNMSVKTYSFATDYPITTPSGRIVNPPSSRCWAFSKDKLTELIADNRIWFGTKGDGVPRIKRFLSEVQNGVVSKTIWLREDVGDNQDAKKEVKEFNNISVFDTPKPERLIQRIFNLATHENDLILDSFAGSGTTGAVAHKMGRRWIMVELGDHCETHIVPRLKKVIDGEDQGGISKAVNWQGGGGFRYFRLAPSLLKKDSWGNWIINKAYNAEMLSEAMCKHMGFQYAPSQAHFWMHGHSTETDFIYVTTGSLSHDQLKVISDEVGNNRTLLICCKAFMAETSAFANLTLKKIPQAILNKCEWDHDDYSFSLNVLPDDDASETCEVLKTSQVLGDSQFLDNEEE